MNIVTIFFSVEALTPGDYLCREKERRNESLMKNEKNKNDQCYLVPRLNNKNITFLYGRRGWRMCRNH